MVKSGTSSPRKVWKSWSAVDDTYWSSNTLRNLFKERVSIFRNFRMDLTVLYDIIDEMKYIRYDGKCILFKITRQ